VTVELGVLTLVYCWVNTHLVRSWEHSWRLFVKECQFCQDIILSNYRNNMPLHPQGPYYLLRAEGVPIQDPTPSFPQTNPNCH
jgi:hypothetical protein